MNEYDRRAKIIETLCIFCPVCAAELVTSTEQLPVRLARVTYEAHRCPNGHGEMSVGPADGDMGPNFIFGLSEAAFPEPPVEPLESSE